MLISSLNDDLSFGNIKRLAINICKDKEEAGEELKPKDIEKKYKMGDYSGIIFKGESFENPEITIREMAYLCDLIEENGGESWAETKLDIETTIRYPKNSYVWFFMTKLNYIFNLKDKELWRKTPIGIGEYHWKTVKFE